MSNYYSDHTRVSNSMLSVLKKSPSEFKRIYIDGEDRKETPSMRIGTALHCLVLEPNEFRRRYAVIPEINRKTKEGKEAFAAWSAFHHASIHLEQSEIVKINEMALAIWGSSLPTRLLSYPGNDASVSIEKPIEFDWLDIACNAKIDLVGRGAVVDLKSTADPSPSGFARSVLSFGYHRQAAFYLHGCREVYQGIRDFIFVCVGNSAPFDVACYTLSEELLEQGRLEVEALLREYRDRKQHSDWTPQWSKVLGLIDKPKWYDAELFEYEGNEDE